MCYRCLLSNIVDANIIIGAEQKLNDRLGPISSVTEQTQITERFLWTAELAFFFT